MPPVKPIPDGRRAVTPYLIEGAAAAAEFHKKAFDAAERMRLAAPDGRVGHAELAIDDEINRRAAAMTGQNGGEPA